MWTHLCLEKLAISHKTLTCKYTEDNTLCISVNRLKTPELYCTCNINYIIRVCFDDLMHSVLFCNIVHL